MNSLLLRLATAFVAPLVCISTGLGQGLPDAFPRLVRTESGVRLASWEKPAATSPAERTEAISRRLKVAPGTVVRLPAPDLEAARLEDEKALQADAKSARRISLRRPLPVRLSPQAGKPGSGWRTLPDGSQLWTAEVESTAALGLRLHFARVSLPVDAELIVFGSDSPAEVSGPYSVESLGGRDAFWSGTVFTSTVTVECRVAAGIPVSQVHFEVDELLHRYVSLPLNPASAKAADDCNLDVTCEPEWLATSKAVAGLGAVQQSGELFCTACLVNDTDPSPGTDYVMTANHCVGSQTEADDTEFYWFYQTATCDGTAPTLASRPRTSGGADFIAGSDNVLRNDFAFLRLRQATPAGVVYAAWNSGILDSGATVVGIHHPRGDFKRISFGEIASFDSDYWSVRWSRGITEPGSSGSPLFNGAHEFVGQLFGGGSSCATPTKTDNYGRFSQSFAVIGDWLMGSPSLAPNDAVANATSLSGLTGQTSSSSAGATKEPGEPAHANNRGGKSVWYRWTAPTSTAMAFKTTGSDFDTLLAVYTGTAIGALSQVAANNDGVEFPLSAVSFPAMAGTTYLIAVDGHDGAGGRLGLEWYPGSDDGTLLNDNFDTAQILTEGRGEVGVFNQGATKEPGEPNHAGNFGGASVWFRWTAPANGEVSFDTEGSEIDTVIAIYQGASLAALGEPIAADDDIDFGAEIFTSRATFQAQAGQTYQIAVDGYGAPDSAAEQGFILLTWQPTTIPAAPLVANDRFAQATLLAGNSGSLSGDNLHASKEAGEPDHGGTVGGNSVWYRWTAEADGLATFDTSGSDFDSVLAVYSGSSVNALTLLGEIDDTDRSTRQSRVTIPVTVGSVYRVAVDGFETDSGLERQGAIRLSWAFETGGRNDNFADAQSLVGDAGRVVGENWAATVEAGEPRHAGGRGGASIWFRWTAPGDGEATFDTLGSSFDTLLAVYQGNSLAGLTEVARGDDISLARGIYTSRAIFSALAGREYHLAVDGFREDGAGALPVDTGSLVLNWRQAASAALMLSQPSLSPVGFSVSVTGNPGETVTLQFATILGTWEDLSSTQLDGSGAGLLDDAAADSREHGFYRAVRR